MKLERKLERLDKDVEQLFEVVNRVTELYRKAQEDQLAVLKDLVNTANMHLDVLARLANAVGVMQETQREVSTDD